MIWPVSRGRQPERSAHSKEWCDYHNFYSHPTNRCIQWKKYIQDKIDAGQFQEYIDRPLSEKDKTVKLTENRRVINTITYSEKAEPNMIQDMAVKCCKRIRDHDIFRIDGVTVEPWEDWMATPLVFSTKDIDQEIEIHNDPLILTIPISGWTVTKVLIDGGSSMNVLYYDTFKRMGFKDEDLVSSPYTIYGFNGASSKPKRDITLEVHAGPMKQEANFSVIDAPSPYNAIMGRLWLHRLKGTTCTYHQYLRFPTPWGEMQIKGDQMEARNCQAIETQINLDKNDRRRKKAIKDKAEIDQYLMDTKHLELEDRQQKSSYKRGECSTGVVKDAQNDEKEKSTK
ncbi:uncharacterized protein LOC113345667 [Papaver somniferum]|uniref:uncharacterized protein LOC113345667 n=1 Tax=Papaver somniferum TaxID=3469 RepID=UPI000E702527|nr:uncharacterized protein LOC113345667 [Papaver somniferum]